MNYIRKSAGELSRKANADTTKYNAIEVGHALADEIYPQIRQAIENHKKIIDEPEFCVIMLIAKDPLIHNLMRRKFYCWPYLPKPRPNQSVFLYNKAKDEIVKRLWILPNDMMMAELHSLSIVDSRYRSMKAWSDAFYHGWKHVKVKKDQTNPLKPPEYESRFINTTPTYFWEYVRKDQNITMPSEHEYFLANREKLIEAGCKDLTADSAEPFDFSKIGVNQVVDSQKSTIF